MLAAKEGKIVYYTGIDIKAATEEINKKYTQCFGI
jgi:hypothetical protein